MNYSDELWWQNLEEWVFDESKVISFKYLSAALKVHVNSAKKMLFTFHEKNERKTSAFYMIAGRLDDALKISVVNENDIDDFEAKLDKVITKHIYALSKGGLKVDVSDLMLFGQNKEDDHYDSLMKFRGINSGKDIIRETKGSSPVASQPAVKSEVKKEVKSSQEKDKVKSEEKKEKVKTPEKKETVKDSKKDVSKSKKPAGKSNAIASMFAKAPPKKEKKEEEKVEKMDEDEKEEKSEDSPGKENKASQEKIVSQSKGKGGKSSNKKEAKPSKTNKKRKRIHMMSDDSDSSDNNEEQEEMEVDLDEQVKP